MSQEARVMHLSSSKLNAAGLTPDHSLVLPERSAQADEVAVLQALSELYAGAQDEKTFTVFSPQVVYALPTGDVVVGHRAMNDKFTRSAAASTSTPTVHQRLLQTPESLPARTMCIDQVVTISDGTSEQQSVHSVRTLIVLKRRATDGLVTNFTEEEGHRRATAPLAARAAAGNSFYSPTDNMVSPCTSKLNLAKKRHHMKGTPTALFASSLAAKAQKAASIAPKP